MASLLHSRRARWAVPAVAAAALIGVGPLVHAVTASAQGSLPPRTAAQLLADVSQAKVQALSGTVVETADLGIPALPSLGGSGGNNASFSSMLSGSHTMRVWYAGPDRQRVALLGQLGESDLVHNGTDVWAWSSHDNTATHWTVPAGHQGGQAAPDSPAAAAMTPQQAAEKALAAIDPSTQVSTDPTASVAGRPAYQLNLVPRDPRSLVGSVRIAIDGATHVPTRVQVFARGTTSPAFEVGFTSLSTSTPDASVFGFTPPPGATVKEGAKPSGASGQQAHVGGLPAHLQGAPQVVGKGWTSVLVADLPSDQQPGQQSGQQSSGRSGTQAMLQALPRVSGAWGSGHLLRTALLSAVLTDDGRVAVGAVPPQLLYRALSAR
jgi:outer membrane lipoprotein-sorting protein